MVSLRLENREKKGLSAKIFFEEDGPVVVYPRSRNKGVENSLDRFFSSPRNSSVVRRKKRRKRRGGGGMERRVKGRMGEWASWKMRRDFIRTVERESNPLTCNEPPHGILAEERLFGLRTIHATDFNRIHCSRNIESLSSSFFFFFPFFFFFLAIFLARY